MSKTDSIPFTQNCLSQTLVGLTVAVTICPSWSILSIVPVGKKGRMTRKERIKYLQTAEQKYVHKSLGQTGAGNIAMMVILVDM